MNKEFKLGSEIFDNVYERKRIIKFQKSKKIEIKKEDLIELLKNIILPRYYKVNKITWEEGYKFFYDSNKNIAFTVSDVKETFLSIYSTNDDVETWSTFEVYSGTFSKDSFLRYKQTMRLKEPIDIISPQGSLIKYKIREDVKGRLKHIIGEIKKVKHG